VGHLVALVVMVAAVLVLQHLVQLEATEQQIEVAVVVVAVKGS
jgi:hypothetical protein